MKKKNVTNLIILNLLFITFSKNKLYNRQIINVNKNRRMVLLEEYTNLSFILTNRVIILQNLHF